MGSWSILVQQYVKLVCRVAFYMFENNFSIARTALDIIIIC